MHPTLRVLCAHGERERAAPKKRSDPGVIPPHINPKRNADDHNINAHFSRVYECCIGPWRRGRSPSPRAVDIFWRVLTGDKQRSLDHWTFGNICVVSKSRTKRSSVAHNFMTLRTRGRGARRRLRAPPRPHSQHASVFFGSGEVSHPICSMQNGLASCERVLFAEKEQVMAMLHQMAAPDCRVEGNIPSTTSGSGSRWRQALSGI